MLQMAARVGRALVLLLTLVVAVSGARAQSPPAVQNPAEQAAYTKALNTQDAAQRAQAMEIGLAWYP